MKTVHTIDLNRKVSQIDVFDYERITGVLRIGYKKGDDWRMQSIPTLENRKYVFPQGIYKIKNEYSPKFKRKLWEFKDVHGRTEIKFHNGSSTKHTKGCILLRGAGISILHNILDSSKEYYINIKNN